MLCFFVCLALGLIFFLTFFFLSKARLSRLSRFFLDVSLTLLVFIAFYAACFFLAFGEVRLSSVIALMAGLTLPRIFISNKNEKDR